MRGKPSGAVTNEHKHRITPADAGKTNAGTLSKKAARDHPRGCGENLAHILAMQVRGRITPADAGKTLP